MWSKDGEEMWWLIKRCETDADCNALAGLAGDNVRGKNNERGKLIIARDAT